MRRNEKRAGPTPAGPPPDLAGLAEKAKAAAQALEAQRAAFKEEMKAEEELLRRVVETVRPALPAIVTRTSGGFRGALVATESGTALYLLEDASFIEISGARLTPRAFPDLAAVLLDWDPEVIIENLAALVEAQLTGRGPSTADARARAAKLTAVAKLLDG
jgi:hypothetical protein